MAKTQKKKAEAFMEEAEKTLAKKSWFSSSKERQTEDAAEIYLQAANAYKVGGLNQEAGETYSKTAELYQNKLNNPNEAAKCYSQAGTYEDLHGSGWIGGYHGRLVMHSHLAHPFVSTGSCFKKSNPTDAVHAYQSAIGLLTDVGRLNNAAKLCKECAELYENEEAAPQAGGKSNIVLAIEFYEQAAELFGMEDAKSQSSQCLAKVAELCSAALDPPDLIRAAQIYDELGRNCLESNLLKYNAKGYFLQSIFCHLAASDSIAATQALERYEGVDFTFGESREGKFCRQLVECVEGYDAEGFATACFEFDRISKLDPWKTSMLVKVKRSIADEAGGEDEDEVDLT